MEITLQVKYLSYYNYVLRPISIEFYYFEYSMCILFVFLGIQFKRHQCNSRLCPFTESRTTL